MSILPKKIIIGTRGSDLALWQARFVQQLLAQQNISSELKIIVTSGDKNQSWLTNFDKSEGKNFFTKEIEDALINKEIDLAVHSFKDVDSSAFDNNNPLIIAGLTARHEPNDVLILHKESVDTTQVLNIKRNAKIGTSSARRYAQLHTFRKDIEILPLRGNVPTRVEKLKNGLYDGIILARAGVERLNINLNDFFVYHIPLHYFVPSAGQGIIAIQIRQSDTELYKLIQSISNKDAEICSKVERSITQYIGGGCSVPIGVLCEKREEYYRLYISFNNDKQQASLLTINEHLSIETLMEQGKNNIQKLNHLLNNANSLNIFISKKLDEQSYLKTISQRLNWKIIDEPLIETKGLSRSAKEIPSFDWIFFNSKNAVKHFFELESVTDVLKNKKIACVSLSTSQYLQKMGYNPDFIGTTNDVEHTGKIFVDYCKHQKVLFPSSEMSNNTIANIIKNDCEVINLPIYTVIEKSKVFNEYFDYYVFTSPSNFRAFIKMNTIPENAKMIAIGTTTQKEILKHNISSDNIYLSATYDDVGIAATLLSIIDVI